MDTGIHIIIRHAARKHGVPEALAVAIAVVESSLNAWAHRAEPAYRYLWDVRHNAPFRLTGVQAAEKRPPPGFPSPAGISSLSEWQAQQASWGLMQVMGAVAREYGLQGPIPQLLDPTLGADYGCRHLAVLRKRFPSACWRGVAQAYNSGSPGATNGYPDKVAAAGYSFSQGGE